jgi:CO/xanthine dehydrogenase Mo-binding subunit
VQDLRLPGMVHARVVRPAMPRARLLEADVATARAMPGVGGGWCAKGSFLAVAAEREEQAIAAWRALHANARWEAAGPLPPRGPALFAYLKTARAQTGVVSEKTAGRRAAPRRHDGQRRIHASLPGPCLDRPLLCRRAVEEGRLQVWTHSQGVFPLRGDLAKTLRIAPANITVMHREGSGCYGHNGADDVALDAALVARALPGIPGCGLQWMREDEFAFEPLGSPMVMQLKAALDGGRIVDWQHELWSYTHSTRPGDPEGSNLLAAWQLPDPLPAGALAQTCRSRPAAATAMRCPLYAFPRQRITNHLLLDQPIRTSALRTLGAYANVFAAESFMDELAGAAGADPRRLPSRAPGRSRARAVIEQVAALAGWQPRPAVDTRDARRPVAAGPAARARHRLLALQEPRGLLRRGRRGGGRPPQRRTAG